MPKKKENKNKKKKRNNFTDKSWFPIIYFALLIVFLVMVVLPILFRVAERSPAVCNYLGKTWLDETTGPNANPDGVRGCYTHIELFKMGRL